MSRVLLTGATGFLGSHLLDELIIKGYEVIVLKRNKSNTERVKKYLNHTKTYDLESNNLDEIFSTHSIDAVIHTACNYGRNSDLNEVVATNVAFGVRLLDLSVRNNVSKFINTDTFFSGKELSGHLAYYSLAKRQFAEWLKLFSQHIDVLNLRLQHVYGSADNPEKFVPWLIQSILTETDRVPLTSGKTQRDFIYVKDVVNAIICAIQFKQGRNAPNFLEVEIGSAQAVSVKNFAEEVYNLIREFRPVSCVLGFGDLKDNDAELSYSSVENSTPEGFNWSPRYDLKSGIREMIELEFNENRQIFRETR